jgi:hypothetical protein
LTQSGEAAQTTLVKKFKPPHPAVADLACRALRAGVPMSAVCQRAKRHPSVWSRWLHQGVTPDPALWLRMNQALTELIEEDNGKSTEGP